jgi:D-alanine-D-alanine ligase
MNYPELIDEMVHCAMKAHQEKNDNNYAFTSDILKNVKLGGKTGVKGSGKLSSWAGGK